MQHWVFWDGACEFCRRSVAWVRRHDRRGRFRFVPYQEAPSPPMTPALREACARDLHVVKADGSVLRAGRAVLFLLEELGWGWKAHLLALPPFVWAVELSYRLIADRRAFFSRLSFGGEGKDPPPHPPDETAS